MRTRVIVGVVAVAVCVQATSVSGKKSTHSPFSKHALEPGAVYEVSLRVPGADAEEYLSRYAKWLLCPDMADKSGRKLLTVLSREIGDDHNLVFVYWYESPYKERYYCQYARAFFACHLGKGETGAELRTMYDDAARLLGVPRKDDGEILAELAECEGNDVPVAAAETMRKVDEQLQRLVVSEQDSWNIGVNPCRVKAISDAEKKKQKVEPSDLESCEKSLLEKTVLQMLATRGVVGQK